MSVGLPTTEVPWIRRGPGDPDPALRLAFFLGAHCPSWLEVSPVPLCVSFRRLCARRGQPKARCLWVLDSGGFTELQMHGTWTLDPDSYGGAVTRILDDCGFPPCWVAPQDWMCEPWVLAGGVHGGIRFAGTGLTVAVHQRFTVENFVYLRDEFSFVPWLPVVQGWTLQEYLDCVDLYEAYGVDLRDYAVVGLGSVCRRQGTREIELIASTLAARGLALHGFGIKTAGLTRYSQHLVSADTQAWSRQARWDEDPVRTAWCRHPGESHNNCLPFALQWRDRVLTRLRRPTQLGLPIDFGGVA